MKLYYYLHDQTLYSVHGCIWLSVSGKLPPRKLPPRKLSLMKIPLYEYSPLWKLPPVKITSQNFPQRKLPPRKILPSWENYPQSNPLPTYKSYKWKKKQNYKILCLEESCAIQHPYQTNQSPLWYTDDFTENTRPRYFLYRVKKIQKSNERANRQVAFTCHLYKSRRTETRQSNYKTWQIGKTTKQPVKHVFHLVN